MVNHGQALPKSLSRVTFQSLRPTARSAIPVFVLLGIGQISAFLGSATLIGQEAPKVNRGSVVGVFNSAGAIGILIASGIGGRLFDTVGPSAPFVLVGFFNGLVLLAAIAVRILSPGSLKPDSVL